MNFNQLVLEELIQPTYHVIRDASEQELATLNRKCGGGSFDKGWLVNLVNRERLIVPSDITNFLYIIFTIRGAFEQYTTDKSKIVSKKGANSIMLTKAIKDWEFKKNLSPNTLNTFGDLIDEL